MENSIFDFCERDSVNQSPISPGFTPIPSGDHPGGGRKWYRKAAHRDYLTGILKYYEEKYSLNIQYNILTIK
ncbi:hypothetical protein L9F63_013399 [Diploptera punctata]|uniref:Uncharacterized protein n=1 Tax=Diploptera punctata TaxID=6984 RepID=A0AAD8AA99_DIPPU|nr:hypothetical protein L9F63_013399 [Diploptera punctata]